MIGWTAIEVWLGTPSLLTFLNSPERQLAMSWA
jgi:hypothetical protein